MTSTEFLAGDFLKNLLKNFPNEDIPFQEKEKENVIIEKKESISQTQKFISSSATAQLRDLKNILKCSSTKDLGQNDSINICLAFPNVININTLIEKILTIFEVKSINELYSNLIDSFKQIYPDESQKENKPPDSNNNDSNSKKNQLFELIQELNFFISPSVIYIQNNESTKDIIKISYDIFIHRILIDNKIAKNILESYINIFNIRHLILDYFVWNKESIIKDGHIHIQKLLALISILHLEKNYTYDFILYHKKNIFLEQDNFVYDLYSTYNTSLKQIVDLTEYLITLKENWVSIIVIEKILYDKNISERIDNCVKKLVINHLIDYNIRNNGEKNGENSIQIKNEKKLIMKLISYYHILSDNKNFINFDFNNEVKELNNMLNTFVKNKDTDKCIKLLNCLDNKFLMHIKNDIFHQMIKEFSLDKIERIKHVLKLFPDEITYILNQYEKKKNFKDGIKLIKSLNLEWKEYDKVWDRYSIRIFYNYKIKECLEDKFDILLDYALISETLYNELINKLLNKLKKSKKENSKTEKENINNINNANNNIKDLEFEFIDNNNNNEISNKNNDSFNDTQLNEGNNAFPELDIINKLDIFNDNPHDEIIAQEDSEEDVNDCRIILNNIKKISNTNLKEKITILFKLGRERNFLLTKNNKTLFDSIFNYNLPKISLSKYIPTDKFGPHNPNCLTLDKKKVHVTFIDSIAKFTEHSLKYFQHSKIIGIDSEWKQQFYARNKEFCSIIQLANFDEKNVMILDMLKLTKEKEFVELFEKYFGNKIFVGYAFDSSDFEHFSTGIQNVFKKVMMIDLRDLYQYKYLKKAKGLKYMCNEVLGVDLCKYEQCSFWENRPLKDSQIHYAAIDALVCVSLYKKIINN